MLFRSKKTSKRALGLRALGSYFLGCFKKKKKITNKNFQFLEKIKNFQIFQKKNFVNQNFQFLQKNSGFPNFFQKKKNPKFSIPLKNSSIPNSKKKKKSSLNSSTGTKSYDLLPHSPMMQHQVNYPPLAFIEA